MLSAPARRTVCAACVPWALLGATPARGAESRPASKDAPVKMVAANPSKGPQPGTKAAKPGHGPDPGERRSIAGGPTTDDLATGAESAELRVLSDADRELFPGSSSAPETAWPGDISVQAAREDAPIVVATGLPARQPAPLGSTDDTALGWLDGLEMPDLPVRWDDRVVRYLQFFRDDPRGHATFAGLYRRSGRWRDMIRRILRQKSLPEDLVWISMIESGFDAASHSGSGAAGLWQFMPETAKIYGLAIDHWVDQRLNASVSTQAAADFLGDLHRRFGCWDLALAAFNMGYAGLASVVRRFNTNDFWALARTEGTLPWETTLYVPKVLATAVVAHNLAAFGFADLTVDLPVAADDVSVPSGTALSTVAQAAGCTPKDVESLNPDLRAARTPPADAGAVFTVKVPPGKGAAVAQSLARWHRDTPTLERYVVRFGETIGEIAAARKTTTQKLVEVNGLSPGEAVHGGTVLFVPRLDVASARPATQGARPGPSAAGGDPSGGSSPGASSSGVGPKPSVVVPRQSFVYSDRKRVFFRVIAGDTLPEIATALQVSPDELRRWNELDPSARLQEGMTLQAYVPPAADLSQVVTASEADVQVLAMGSDEFFAALERDKGFRRVTVVARAGDTIESIGRRFDASARTMERINRRGRAEPLKSGEAVVVYVPSRTVAPGSHATTER